MRISLIAMIILLLGLFGMGYMHEQVHVAIYSSYGVESHVEYFSHFPNFVTIAEEPCPTEMCNLAHNINEVVGYPLAILYCVFGLVLFISLCLKEANYDLEKFKLDIKKREVKDKWKKKL